jgi:hypothetical protein
MLLGLKHIHLHCDLADSENMETCVRENLKNYRLITFCLKTLNMLTFTYQMT